MKQNDELYQACKAWLQAALQLLTAVPIPYKQDFQVTFTANGYQAQGVPSIDKAQVYILYRTVLFSLPEYNHIVEVVTNTPALSSVLFVDGAGNALSEPKQQAGVLERYFATFLTEYITRTGGFNFSVETYNHIYDALEEYIFTTEPFDGIWSVHFRNLTSDLDTICIDRTVSLRRATYEEKVDVIRNNASNPLSRTMSDVPEFFLDIHESIDRATLRKSAPSPQEAMSIVQEVVLALRLLKANPIGIASYQWTIPNQPFVIYRGMTYPLMLRHFDYRGDSYHVTQEDADALQKLWHKVKKAYNKTELSTVITRFDDSYTRTKPEDKLIDYWTALEALFFLEDEFQDMGKSLALAASYYLGRTSSERRTIYNDLTRSHTLRSYYIHGERKQIKHSLDEMVTKTGSHLRNALRKRIEE